MTSWHGQYYRLSDRYTPLTKDQQYGTFIFILLWAEQSVEQTVNLIVIWDTMTLCESTQR